MPKQYGEKVIKEHLRRETIGILGTLDKGNHWIRLRVMYYGIDNKFNFYLMSTKGSPKIDQMLSSTSISFIVYRLEDPYDASWEVEINGGAEILTNKKNIQNALNTLKDINPFADVAAESGITGHFDFIKLVPKMIRFCIYGNALKGDPPTVIER